MLRGNFNYGKADAPKIIKLAKPSQSLEPTSPSGHRTDGGTVSPLAPSSPLKSAAARPAKSTSSDGGDSTKNNITVKPGEVPKSNSGDVVSEYRSQTSLTMPPVEDAPAGKSSSREELFKDVKGLLGEVLAGIDVERTSKRDKQRGLVVLDDSDQHTVRATEDDMPTELLPTVAVPPAGRSGGGRGSCDLTVRFADTEGLEPRAESATLGSRPQKKPTGAASQSPGKTQQPQQGSSLWPFRRGRPNKEAPKLKNAAAKPQPKSTPTRRDSAGAPITSLVDSELATAMDRKISWGKAKAYPGSVTLSELNDDGTGTSKTKSLRRIKKKKPEPPPKPKSEGAASLLRSILGIASSSQKATAASTPPHAKGGNNKRPRQPAAPRQPSDKESASGSKARKSPQQKDQRTAGTPKKSPPPLPSLKEVPENVTAAEAMRAEKEVRAAQLLDVKSPTENEHIVPDTPPVKAAKSGPAAGGQCAEPAAGAVVLSKGPETETLVLAPSSE